MCNIAFIRSGCVSPTPLTGGYTPVRQILPGAAQRQPSDRFLADPVVMWLERKRQKDLFCMVSTVSNWIFRHAQIGVDS